MLRAITKKVKGRITPKGKSRFYFDFLFVRLRGLNFFSQLFHSAGTSFGLLHPQNSSTCGTIGTSNGTGGQMANHRGLSTTVPWSRIMWRLEHPTALRRDRFYHKMVSMSPAQAGLYVIGIATYHVAPEAHRSHRGRGRTNGSVSWRNPKEDQWS